MTELILNALRIALEIDGKEIIECTPNIAPAKTARSAS